jgi:hypothetical protein
MLAAERANGNDLGLANARLALAPSTGAMRFVCSLESSQASAAIIT